MTSITRITVALGLIVACAVPTWSAEENLPRVLILGDSISIGYTPYVVETLDGEAVVIRPRYANGRPENCAGTNKGVHVNKGVMNIDRWLAIDGGDWDVIHFNFGLHDLKHVDPETGRGSTNPKDPLQATLEVYKRQLTEIVEHLEQSDARLIFATTTPVPQGEVRPLRDPADVVKYNNAARKIMRAHGIAIDDLYGFAMKRLDEIQRPGNVHFIASGYQALAEVVAKSIRKALDEPADDGE